MRNLPAPRPRVAVLNARARRRRRQIFLSRLQAAALSANGARSGG